MKKKSNAALLQWKTAYKVAAGAAAAALGGADASAEIQYLNIGVSISPENYQTVEINGADPNGYNPNPVPWDIQLKNYYFTQGQTGPYQGIFLRYYPSRFVGFFTNGLHYVSALTAGTYIDSSDVGNGFQGVLAFGANPNSEFDDVEDAYFGFSFAEDPNLSPPSRQTLMGWMRVTIDNANGVFIVKDAAFQDDPNLGITIGDTGALTPGDLNADGRVDATDFLEFQRGAGTIYNFVNLEGFEQNYGTPLVAATQGVPEPGTLGLLAAGSLGLTCLRHRRVAQHQAKTAQSGK